jgi:phosphopantetheinyl transferase
MGRPLPRLLVLALSAFLAGALGAVSVSIGVLGSPDHQNSRRKLLSLNESHSGDAAAFEVRIALFRSAIDQ